ncbi:hypothetical protein BpHYR1_022978 [Brachionus plicatilis]|uniref:Uncharacterized protein n=1 Tax=Brachionus plicatilis TaxID=10195 RepID=A0A3M7QY44_BRAPC|nr:hypothetical protein BpHYR1_022978 [Brachionus plicatilis]
MKKYFRIFMIIGFINPLFKYSLFSVSQTANSSTVLFDIFLLDYFVNLSEHLDLLDAFLKLELLAKIQL